MRLYHESPQTVVTSVILRPVCGVEGSPRSEFLFSSHRPVANELIDPAMQALPFAMRRPETSWWLKQRFSIPTRAQRSALRTLAERQGDAPTRLEVADLRFPLLEKPFLFCACFCDFAWIHSLPFQIRFLHANLGPAILSPGAPGAHCLAFNSKAHTFY